ncbi:MAG: hypothetical protein ACLTT1_06440 [[Clostridium] scindens]
MKKGKRIIALFLAVLMIATSDTGVYQAFGMDAANQASEAEEAAGGEGQSSGTVDQAGHLWSGARRCRRYDKSGRRTAGSGSTDAAFQTGQFCRRQRDRCSERQ